MLKRRLKFTSLSYTDKRPKLPTLLKFPVNAGYINIPQRIGNNYDQFGILLLDDADGAIVGSIVDKSSLAIFKKWLREGGRLPITWRTLINCLRDANLLPLADEIEANLCQLHY